ncbi:MAG: transporter substrate-binding domain-containing protein [Candidatus Limnocylindrales bacterium]
MRRTVPLTAAALLAIVVAACSGTGTASSPSAAAPTVAPSTAASDLPSVAPSIAASPTPDACAKESLALTTPGMLTIGADNPAFPPYYQGPPEGETATAPWEFGDPNNGQGFEAATAYAIAESLGFTKAEVTWIPVPFNNAIQPGDKPFDLYLTQASFSAERAQAVDLSDGYFDLTQAVVSLADNPIAKVTTVAGLKDFKLGAPIGTTSLTYITDVIAPTAAASVYDTLDAAIQSVTAKQIDGVVVDLPTAFFVRDAQLTGGQIVGSLPPVGEEEHFSAVLDKGSPLTACVNEAIASIKADGSLTAITDEWITGQGAPALTP